MSVDEPSVRVRQRRDDDLRSPSPDAASSASSTASSASATATSSTATSSTEDDDEPGLPYPGFVPVALYYFVQDKPPRSWCLRMLTNPYPFGTALYGMWIVCVCACVFFVFLFRVFFLRSLPRSVLVVLWISVALGENRCCGCVCVCEAETERIFFPLPRLLAPRTVPSSGAGNASGETRTLSLFALSFFPPFSFPFYTRV